MLFYSKYLSRPPAAGARAKRVQANGAAGAGAAPAGPSNIEDFCAATHKVARNTDAGGFFHVHSESISSGVASASARSGQPVMMAADGGGSGESGDGGDGLEEDEDDAPSPLARDLVFLLNGPAGIALFFGLWYLAGGDRTADIGPISLEGVY